MEISCTILANNGDQLYNTGYQWRSVVQYWLSMEISCTIQANNGDRFTILVNNEDPLYNTG